MSPILIGVLAALGAQETPPVRVSSVVGDVRHHAAFESKRLGNSRDLWVYVPPGYESEPRRSYPVLYMHDGQNAFDGATSFLPNCEWRADESAEALIRARLIEPILIVAVANAGVARADEYLPTRARWDRVGGEAGGKADDYGRFLVEEVKPFIDRTYRTRPGPEDTGLAGSSFGGISTLHLGLTRHDVFRRLAVVSPSLWWDGEVMVERVEALGEKLPLRVWLDVGTAEAQGLVTLVERVHAALVARGWRPGRDLATVVDSGGRHREDSWAARFDAILMFLFPRR